MTALEEMPVATALPTILDARVVTGSGGGPDKTILTSPQFMEPLGYRMLCGYLAPPDDPGFAVLESKARQHNAPLIRVDDRGPWDWRIIRRLLQICRKQNVVIWHGHDYKTNALGLLLKRFHPMRLVTTVHGWVQHTARTPLYYRIDKWCLRHYEQVICVSDDLHSECLRIGVPVKRCVLVENAIDAEDFRRRRSVASAKIHLGLDPQQQILGAVGRLSDEKGFDVLIRALRILADTKPLLRLMIVGEGSERLKLETLIRELNLSDRVSLPGWRTDVRELYEAMDVFVLSSRREGLPNVLLEAMALEVPIVATAVNGVPRVVRDGIEGRLVPADDASALASRISELLDDPASSAKLCKAGRQRIEHSFSFPARMKKIADLYDRMLQ